MNFLTTIIDLRIDKIIRHDWENKYVVKSPLGLHFQFENYPIGLTISVNNDGESLTIERESLEDFKNYGELEYDYGDINDLNDQDPLNKLIGKEIKDVKVYSLKPEVQADNFTMIHNPYRKIILLFEELIFSYEHDGFTIH